jgi:hypothetical protein
MAVLSLDKSNLMDVDVTNAYEDGWEEIKGDMKPHPKPFGMSLRMAL